MTAISLDDYFQGRNLTYADELTEQLVLNARRTVYRANALLAKFGEYREVNSGWRPPAVNAITPNAARKSRHMTCEAIDLADDEGDLDEWCFENQQALESIGLWMEHPAATKGWCHLQTVPPRSKRRVFYP